MASRPNRNRKRRREQIGSRPRFLYFTSTTLLQSRFVYTSQLRATAAFTLCQIGQRHALDSLAGFRDDPGSAEWPGEW